MAYNEAEKAVNDGSYKFLPDGELHEMERELRNVGGVNAVNVERVRKCAELIREELSSREKRKIELQSLGLSSPISNQAAQNNASRPSSVWDEARLQQMIGKIEESHTLEYKAADALKNKKEITKDVAAMANSAGGTLIYGLREFADEARSHLPERLDPINRVQFPKEWLENVISNIAPRIPDLRIHPVSLASGVDHVAYVVEIPQGSTAHQSNDFRYYRRYDFQSVPMYDHEIRDVMNRRTQPRAEVSAKFVLFAGPNPDGSAGNLIFRIRNVSDAFGRYVALAVNVPLRFKGQLLRYRDGVLVEETEGASYLLRFSNHSGAPLFPRAQLEAHFLFQRVTGTSRPMPTKDISRIRFTVFIDSMPKEEGEFDLDDIVAKS